MKNRIDKEIKKCLRYLDKRYSLKKLSPLLFNTIKDFVLRDGKRIRPILFIAGYSGFSKRPARNIYMSALSFELLHDYMLIHDDIIDKSDTRRGRPSAHKLLSNYLAKYKNAKCTGEDLAISLGDVMCAMAIDCFLAVKENLKLKEEALRRFIGGAVYTGIGEFTELLLEVNDIGSIKKDDIYKIYDLKTAYYTFACPLTAGAVLAGAGKKQVDVLFKYGMCLGRAFQIQDDILGVFGDEKITGKSSLTDLQEGKKTVLLWYAYKNTTSKHRKTIKGILLKNRVNQDVLRQFRSIIIKSGALDYAKKEISELIKNARVLLQYSKIKPLYKELLIRYSEKILRY